jgi:molybdopterin synthase sulfur carrier subunit
MQIKVLYFARVAELTGKRSEDWPLTQAITGHAWLELLRQRYPELGSVNHLKLAVNQYHVNHQALINPGDEVAVFEPVTGG